MRHRVSRHHLGRASDQRKAVLRALATELLRHDEIVTTLAKAKAVQPEVEKLISKGKKGCKVSDKKQAGKNESGNTPQSIHLRRQVAAFVYDDLVVKKLFDEIAPRYQDRQGGYTRIIKTGSRRGDTAPMAIIQLV